MTQPSEQPVHVWAATWVPGDSPISGFRAAGYTVGDGGYAVAWVDGVRGREQVLVSGRSAPGPGCAGTIDRTAIDGVDVAVFTAGAEGE